MNNHNIEKEEKMFKILNSLIFLKDDSEERVNRWQLKHHIETQLNIGDPHIVNGWVDRVLAYEFISPNPHTNLTAHTHSLRPSNDTYYFLNKQAILKFLASHPRLLPRSTT